MRKCFGDIISFSCDFLNFHLFFPFSPWFLSFSFTIENLAQKLYYRQERNFVNWRVNSIFGVCAVSENLHGKSFNMLKLKNREKNFVCFASVKKDEIFLSLSTFCLYFCTLFHIKKGSSPFRHVVSSCQRRVEKNDVVIWREMNFWWIFKLSLSICVLFHIQSINLRAASAERTWTFSFFMIFFRKLF